MNTIEALKWRYATKKFDAHFDLPTDQLEQIKQSIQLAPSSYGLQPYQVLHIKDSNLRETLKPVSWGQPQITDASELLVFCNYSSMTNEQIDSSANAKGTFQNLPQDQVAGYAVFMKTKVGEKSPADVAHWNAKQTYIALANAMNMCAELELDCCPIEGFEADKYNDILGLTEKGLQACVVLAIGKRSEEDQTMHKPKYRRPADELFLSFD